MISFRSAVSAPRFETIRTWKPARGPWVDLNTYAVRRQLPLSHRFVFSHGYCPDCVAHFDERMAAYRPTTVWESLRRSRASPLCRSR